VEQEGRGLPAAARGAEEAQAHGGGAWSRIGAASRRWHGEQERLGLPAAVRRAGASRPPGGGAARMSFTTSRWRRGAQELRGLPMPRGEQEVRGFPATARRVLFPASTWTKAGRKGVWSWGEECAVRFDPRSVYTYQTFFLRTELFRHSFCRIWLLIECRCTEYYSIHDDRIVPPYISIPNFCPIH
jgi:hypothetical protein